MSKKKAGKNKAPSLSPSSGHSGTWNLPAFVQTFKDSIDQDTRYCFILGSGASFTSRVPTGAILVDNWIADMHRTQAPGDPETNRQAWAENAFSKSIPGFTWSARADFYGYIYQRRFPDYANGQAYLRKLMEGKVPAFGYTVLARILATTQHNLLITTNFDDLAHDALTALSCRPPFIAHSHEEARFLDLHDRRPRIIKIHGDIDRETYNIASQIDHLHEDWTEPLRRLLGTYTPIFLGYGGCDPGFMQFLTEVYQPSPARPRPIWAYRVDGLALNAAPRLADDPPGKPGTGLCQAFMAKHQGWWLPTPGFDELMLLLGQALKIEHGGKSIRAAADTAAKAYQETLTTALKTARNHDGSAWCPQLDYLTKQAEQDLLGEAKLRRWEEWNEYIEAATSPAEERGRCEDAIKERPEDPRAYARFGDALSAANPSDPAVEEAFSKAKERLDGLPADGPEFLSVLNCEATHWIRRGRANEAQAAFERLVEKYTNHLGAEHSDTLSSRNNLAAALQAQDKYPEAEQEHRAVLAIQVRVLGAEHPATLTSRNNLASTLRAQGKYREAEEANREVLAIRERVLGAEHPETLGSRNNLGAALQAQGKYLEAEKELRLVLAIRERVVGAEHLSVFLICHNLATCLGARKQNIEALGLAKRALVGWRKVLGQDHEWTKEAQVLVNRLEGSEGN